MMLIIVIFLCSLEMLFLKCLQVDHLLVFPGILEHLVILQCPDIPKENKQEIMNISSYSQRAALHFGIHFCLKFLILKTSRSLRNQNNKVSNV